MTYSFNNSLDFLMKKNNCDIFIASDHNPIININDDIRFITFNTQHCYLKYKDCKDRENLDNEFCNIKDKLIIKYITKYTRVSSSYDFIFLQEVFFNY